jgi:GT2 family glycosyltransferase
MQPATAPRLSILIVNFNTGGWLRDCLASLFAVLPAGTFDVLVLDNASSDDSVARAKDPGRPIAWTLLTENVGFAAGNNRLAEQASGRYICLLNPDTVLRSDSLTPMVDYLEAHPDVGIAGPHHTAMDGGWQLSFGGEVTVQSEFLYALNPKAFWGRYPAVTPEEPVDVAWLSGSCFVMPASLVRTLGLFDLRFFLNDEDIDLCRRIRAIGRRVVYVPVRGLVHHGGISRPFLAQESGHTRRSRAEFFRKHYSLPAQMLVRIAFGLRRTRDWLSRMRR